MHMPRDLLNFENPSWSKASLVKMFANWFSIAICSMITTYFSTKSLMKWCLISMCFVRECCTRFLDIFIALQSSHNITSLSLFNPLSSNICFIQISCPQQPLAALRPWIKMHNVACNKTKRLNRSQKKYAHEVHILFDMSPAQLASLNLTTLLWNPWRTKFQNH